MQVLKTLIIVVTYSSLLVIPVNRNKQGIKCYNTQNLIKSTMKELFIGLFSEVAILIKQF